MKRLGLEAEGLVLLGCGPISSFLGRLSWVFWAWDWRVNDQGVLCHRTFVLVEILKKHCHSVVVRRNRVSLNRIYTVLGNTVLWNFSIFRKVTKIVQSVFMYSSPIPNVNIWHNHSIVIKVRKWTVLYIPLLASTYH